MTVLVEVGFPVRPLNLAVAAGWERRQTKGMADLDQSVHKRKHKNTHKQLNNNNNNIIIKSEETAPEQFRQGGQQKQMLQAEQIKQQLQKHPGES